MTFQSVPAALPIAIATMVSLAILGFAWRRRSDPLGMPFAIMMAGQTLWAAGATLEPLIVELPIKRLVLDVRLMGTATAILGLLAFVLRFAGLTRWLQPRRFLPFCVPALPILVSAWTDPWLHFYWARFENRPINGAWIAVRSPGPGFWAFFAYGYLLAALATGLLIRELFRRSGPHRLQAAVMLFGVLTPWLVDILDTTRVWGYIPVDLVSVSFGVTGLTFLPALAWLGLLELTPVAWAAVVERMGDAVIVIDEKGRIAALNPSASRLIGRPAAQVRGVEARRVFESWPPLPALVDRIGAEAELPEAGAEVVRPGAEPPRYYEACLSRLSEPEQSAGWVLVLRDITEGRRAAEERARMVTEQEARAKAEAANSAKDVVLAMLSHELRTPLTPVLATVSAMLDDPSTPPALRSTLTMIRRNIDLEARLIDNLLDQTRIQRGIFTLHPEVVDAHELIDQAIDICADEIHDADLTVISRLHAAEHHLDADATAIQQILWNLIKNAIKFSPPRTRIVVHSWNRDATGREAVRPWLIVEVADQGIGIEPEQLPRIFELFERGDPIRGRSYGGLGLGLAISRAIAERHGGRLVATSAGAGEGATFTLELPTVPRPSPHEAAGPEIRPEPDQGRRTLRLLLVEDNKDTLRSLSEQLRKRGYAVRTASTLAGAKQLLAESGCDLDLLVSDIELPDRDGHELMATIRLQAPIPGIALSGFGGTEDIHESLAAGFAEHLTKPVEFRVLEQCIQRVAAQAPAR